MSGFETAWDIRVSLRIAWDRFLVRSVFTNHELYHSTPVSHGMTVVLSRNLSIYIAFRAPTFIPAQNSF